MPSILFLCTGNYYRSRYAEVMFNHHAAEQNLSWQADSRGLRVDHEQKINPGPLSSDARDRLEMLGRIDPTCERMPISVTRSDLEEADMVVAIKHDEHLPMMQDQFPDWAQKITYWQVHDRPPAADYDPMHDIDQELQNLISQLPE